MKPLTEDAQQKISDSHIYFGTMEIVHKTLRLNFASGQVVSSPIHLNVNWSTSL